MSGPEHVIKLLSTHNREQDMHWEMAWDLFWFRTFAICSSEWFDWLISITYVDHGGAWYYNDNRRQS